MSDRVDAFLREFEAAIDDQLAHEQRVRMVARAKRLAEQLYESLDQLASIGVSVRVTTSHDLQALIDEFSKPRAPAQLEPFISKALALMTVLEDGLVDGDMAALRVLLDKASETRSHAKKRRRPGSVGSSPLNLLELEGRSFTSRSKRGIRTVTVVNGQWVLDDGTEHRSPTAAAKAAMGTTASGRPPKVNGRRYWGIADNIDAVEEGPVRS